MKQRVSVKRLRPRGGKEYAAYRVGIRHSAVAAVVRGTDPHDIESPRGSGRVWHHPGSDPNDIFGRAKARAETAFVDEVLTEMKKVI